MACFRYCLAILIAAAASPAAAADARLGFEDARHLLARTGFMPRPDEIAAFEGLTRREAVAKLIADHRTTAVTPPPGWTANQPTLRAPGRMLGEIERKEFRQTRRAQSAELVGWWYREMAATPSPLTERMTLFWHNHFTSSLQKVRSPHLLYGQNATLRRHALGNFRQFVHAMAADPAMVVYLDSARNRKGQPNENFARELLELFTLGEGHYGEDDIREAARAFTGWSIDRDSGEFLFRRAEHDDGEKRFFGRSGALTGADIIDAILTRERVAEHITGKAWHEFVSETPDVAEVRRIAAAFRESGYEIKALLSEILLSSHFWAPGNRARLVRSPAELIAGTMRFFALDQPDDMAFVQAGRAMGQLIFNPPNVKGWPGGTSWITANTLLARQQLLHRMAGAAEREKPPQSAGRDAGAGSEMKDNGSGTAEARRTRMSHSGKSIDSWFAQLPERYRRPDMLARLLLPAPPIKDDRAGATGADLARALIHDPVFQLK